jgi:amino acid transporter
MVDIGITELLIVIIVFILFIITLQKLLGKCAPQNRAISPTAVWFLIFPIINVVMGFVIVFKIAKTLDREFKSRNIKYNPVIEKIFGFMWCTFSIGGYFPESRNTLGIVSLVFWILYWIKIAGNLKLLVSSRKENYLLNNPKKKRITENDEKNQEMLGLTKKCSNCGSEIYENDKFCRSCGLRVK